jgi:stalled ribosome rescue protein Dom34
MPHDSVVLTLETKIKLVRHLGDRSVEDETLTYCSQVSIEPKMFVVTRNSHGQLLSIIEVLQKSVLDSKISKDAYEKTVRIIGLDLNGP